MSDDPKPEPEIPPRPEFKNRVDAGRWETQVIRSLVKAGMTDAWISEKMAMPLWKVINRRGPMKERPRRLMRRGLPKDFVPKPARVPRYVEAGRENTAKARAVLAEMKKKKLMEEQP